MIDEVAEAQATETPDLTVDRVDRAMVAEGRRRVCLTTAVHLLMHNLLLTWEVVDYAKYLEDYLRNGTVPRDEVLAAKEPASARRRHKSVH